MEICSYANHGFKDPIFLLIRKAMPVEEMETFERDCEQLSAKLLSHKMKSSLMTTQRDNETSLWVVVDASNASIFIIKYGNIIKAKMSQEQILTLSDRVKDVPKDDQLSLLTAAAQYGGNPTADEILDNMITMSSIPTIFNKAITALMKHAGKSK